MAVPASSAAWRSSGAAAGLPILLNAVGASHATRTLALVLEWPLLIMIC